MRQPKRRVTNNTKAMTPEIVPPMTAPVLMEEEGVGVSKEEVGSEEEEADTAIEELVSVEVIVGTAAMVSVEEIEGVTSEGAINSTSAMIKEK